MPDEASPRPNERTPLLPDTVGTTALAGTLPLPAQISNHAHSHENPERWKSTTDEEAGPQSEETGQPPVVKIVLVLLIGIFISNADSSILIATHPVIASEFDALHDSTWLLTSFGLAQAATQPLYGRISDIFGRKTLLLVAYTLFGVGCAWVGVGISMSHLILGRVVSGLGSSGMTALVSILITDLVPLRSVAAWRSYINVVATIGRSIGGPLGGWLADTVGWRWSFLGQAPLAGMAIILIIITIPARNSSDSEDESKQSKLSRVDFLGAISMALAIFCFLFPLEIGGDRLPWTHPVIFALFGGGCAFGILFLITEARYAKEPIIPLSILVNRDIVLSSLMTICQCVAQIGLMIAIPLYFQLTAKASNTVAGAHLFPAVAGNAIGGIISGIVIKRNGRYKSLTLTALLIASIGYLLLILRWHGNTNWLETLYIVPGGFGMGVLASTLFVSIQAAIDPSLSAVATSSLYLAGSVGMCVGMAASSAVLQSTLKVALKRHLSEAGFQGPRKLKIIERAVSDVHYADTARPRIGYIVVQSYVEALTWTHVLSLACSLTSFIMALFLRQHKL